MHAGQVVRSARKAANMTLADLGERCGYSAAQVSRYERGLTRLTDIGLLRTLAGILAIPPGALGLSPDSGLPDARESADLRSAARGGRRVVAGDGGKEDPVRRRDLLLGAGLAAPAVLLARVDAALAIIPAPRTPATMAGVTRLLADGHAQFGEGRLTGLVEGLPGLLAAGHDLHERSPGDERCLALLSGCYDLAAETLHKSGSAQAARISADRAVTYARLSGDLGAEAMAARSLAVVLRHEGRADLAAAVTRAAAGNLTATGLRAPGAAGTLAQVLCTAAYSAAQAGDRAEADAMITEARKVAGLTRAAPCGVPSLTVTPAQAALYQVGIWWSLGEPGKALDAARGLRPGQFPTPERRARLYTDMARVWDLGGQADRAVSALLTASTHAASEVRDRPSIRALALGLVRDHPAGPGAARLRGILDSAERRQP
jgi:transcriptional regulator with XRE-family HTH domain